MDLNLVLCWIVGGSCLFGLLRIASARNAKMRGWLAVFGALAGLLSLGLWLRPERAGFWAAPIWTLLILLPSLGSRFLRWMLLGHHYRLALPLSRILALLHPFDGWRQQPLLVRALECLQLGESEEAQRLLAELAQVDTPLARSAKLLEVQARQDWEGFLSWADGLADRDQLLRDPSMQIGYLRALGETGQRASMLHRYHEFTTRRPQTDVFLLSLMRMNVAAFAGLPGTVKQLLEGPLSSLAPPIKASWLASARQVAGEHQEAEVELRAAAALAHADGAQPAGGNLTRNVERRIQHPLPALAPDELDREARRVLSELEREVSHERQFAPISSSPRRAIRATWLLAASLIAVFVVELCGGSSTDLDNLVDLGALVLPTERTPGESWRIFTAGFLHFGPLHLTLNLLALTLLGRWLERATGARFLLSCYLTSTLASTALAPWLTALEAGETQVLVGASGGVMGLLGALLGRVAVGRLRGRSLLVSRQLRLLVALVAFQVIFDSWTPNVSSACHLVGLGTGLLWGSLGTWLGKQGEPAGALRES